jgi:hypothetical protein
MKLPAIGLMISLCISSCNGNKADHSEPIEAGPGRLSVDGEYDKDKKVVSVEKQSPSTALANVRLISEYKVGVSEYFKKKVGNNFEFPDDFAVKDGILYLLSYHNNNLVILDSKTGLTTSNQVINKLIRECSEKYYGVNNVYVVGDRLYLKCQRAVIQYNFATEEVIVTPYSKSIQHLLVLSDQSFVSFSVDTATHFDASGKLVKGYKFPEFIHDDAINYRDTIFEKSHNKVYLYSLDLINNGELYREVTFANSAEEGDRKYLHAITPSYYVMVDFKIRDRIFLIDRNSNKLVREVKLDPDLLKQESLDIQDEDVANGIRIVAEDDNNFYILLMKNKVIQVFHLKA